MYRSNQTTSTKCQYHAAKENPTDFSSVIVLKLKDWKIKKPNPTKTWNPWNPVNTKNRPPQTLHLIEKEVDDHSINWTTKNTAPKKMVTKREKKNPLERHKFLCPQVKETAEKINSTDPKRGTPAGLMIPISLLGEVIPISLLGESKKWKNLQKKQTKKTTSENRNHKKPTTAKRLKNTKLEKFLKKKRILPQKVKINPRKIILITKKTPQPLPKKTTAGKIIPKKTKNIWKGILLNLSKKNNLISIRKYFFFTFSEWYFNKSFYSSIYHDFLRI